MKAAREERLEARREKMAVPSEAPPTEKSVVRGGLAARRVEVKLRSSGAWVWSIWNWKVELFGLRNA